MTVLGGTTYLERPFLSARSYHYYIAQFRRPVECNLRKRAHPFLCLSIEFV